MKALYKALIFGLSVLCMISCTDESMFKGELYKKQVYIVSNNDGIFDIDISLDTVDTVESHFSFACGGTEHIKQDVDINFAYYDSLIDKYNRSNFDIDKTKFAKRLDSTTYVRPSFKATLSAANPDVYVKVPLYIRPSKLDSMLMINKMSPDSTYFLPFKITSVSNLEINPKKSFVKCRIYFHNRFATTKSLTYYDMKGTTQVGTAIPSGVSTSKVVQPMSKNRVRFFVGTNVFSSKLTDIKKFSMVVTVLPNDSLRIAPLDPTQVQVQLLTPPANDRTFLYPNIYHPIEKRFKLYYQYKLVNTTNNLPNGTWPTAWTVSKELVSLPRIFNN